MITREDYAERVMEGTLKNAVQTLLRTKEYSSKFLPRKDVASIDEEIDRISAEVASRLISKLEAKGLLDDESKISEGEFDTVFRSTIDEYFGELSEGKAV